MNKEDIVLDRNADCITTDELAAYLVHRYRELVREYETIPADNSFRDYVNGLLSGWYTVLIKVGYPVSLVPDYEDN